MKNENLFEIFIVLSKAIIVIPIAVLIIALVMKYNQQPQTKNIFPTPAKVLPTVKPTTEKINFDLKGPLICQGKIDEASVSAYIKNKNIKIVIDKDRERENILVAGDCFYNWEKGDFSGKRICGLSSLLSVAETMAGFGGFNAGFLFSQLNNFGVNTKIATDQAKIADLVNTCKKEIIDDKVFIVPTNILFRNNRQ